MNTYKVVMSGGTRTEKTVEGDRFVIDEPGKLLIYKSDSSHASRASLISEQELAFVANIGEWVSIEVV